MQRTPASEDRLRAKLERAVEDILYQHPHLIQRGLPRPRRQVQLNKRDRVDLFFEHGSSILIVEIKRAVCGVLCVRQLERYLRFLAKRHADAGTQVRGILVGARLSPAAARVLGDSKFALEFMELDKDVPTQIQLCANCREVYAVRLDRCPDCQCTKVVH